MPEYFELSSRRYLGAKRRLLPFIKQIVSEHTSNINSVADLFAGTGEVSDLFAQQGKKVIVNDILHCNYTIYQAFFGNEDYDKAKLLSTIARLNSLTGTNSYLINAYGGTYFTKENANLIGLARDWVEDNRLMYTPREKAILITSILYAADKISNTFGHYDAYRKALTQTTPICFKMPLIHNYAHMSLYKEDANQLARKIKADLVYIDPPYNGRQYVDNYHVLENITDWQKPEVFGVTRKFANRESRKSKYSTVNAPKAFADLISHLDTHYILVSFNNMEHKASERASSKISQKQLITTLQTRGQVEVYAHDFPAYTTGKSKIQDNQELLYLVKVVK